MTADDDLDDDDLDPVVLQAAADALAARHGHQHVAAFAEDYRAMAAPVVRAVTPLIRAQALRDHAAWLRAQYPEDIFIPVNEDTVQAVHTAFGDYQLSVDQWSAHLMRHAATLAEHHADQEQQP